jgi:hypothetical protein
MARLPDAQQVFGVMGGLRSGRPISSYDDSAIARGEGAMGEAIAKGARSIGRGLAAVGEGIEDERIAADNLDLAKAKSFWTSSKIDHDSSFDADTDYKTLPTRYEKGLAGIREKAAAMLPSPLAREKFLLDTEPDMARGRAAAKSKALGLKQNTDVGYALEQGTKFQQQAIDAPDEATRVEIMRQQHALIDGLSFLTPAQRLQNEAGLGASVRCRQHQPAD